jgi:hypothetical protein
MAGGVTRKAAHTAFGSAPIGLRELLLTDVLAGVAEHQVIAGDVVRICGEVRHLRDPPDSRKRPARDHVRAPRASVGISLARPRVY